MLHFFGVIGLLCRSGNGNANVALIAISTAERTTRLPFALQGIKDLSIAHNNKSKVKNQTTQSRASLLLLCSVVATLSVPGEKERECVCVVVVVVCERERGRSRDIRNLVPTSLAPWALAAT